MTEEAEERDVVCSACYQVFPESRIHVLPWFNTHVGAFVTTYRCDGCWPVALADTRVRLAVTEDESEIASAAMVLESHSVFIHEFRRGDPVAVVRKILLRMCDLLESGAIRLKIGSTQGT